MKKTYHLGATAAYGLEGVVANELKRMGFDAKGYAEAFGIRRKDGNDFHRFLKSFLIAGFAAGADVCHGYAKLCAGLKCCQQTLTVARGNFR